MMKLLITLILLLAPVPPAYQSNKHGAKIFFVARNEADFSVSSITIDNPKDVQTLTTIPVTFDSTIEELFTEHEIEFMQSYVEDAPNHGLNIPESSMDLDRDRQFSTSIEVMLAAPDNQEVAVTAKHSFCISEFRDDSCFGVYEILVIEETGMMRPVLTLGMHEINEPFLRDCLGLPRFHSIKPKLVDWTFDSNWLVITTEGLGSCFYAGRPQPLVLVDTTVQTAPILLGIGKQLALQSHSYLAAISSAECGGCTTAISIVDYGDGSVSPIDQIDVGDFLGQQIFWLSENRVLLFGLDLRPLEQQIPVAIILNTDSGTFEFHELETHMSCAELTASQNSAVIQQHPDELSLLSFDTLLQAEPFYKGNLRDWKIGPDDLILIQPTEGEEWHIIDMEGETISEFTLISDGDEIISVDW